MFSDFEKIQLSFMRLVIELLMNLVRDDCLKRQNVLMNGAKFNAKIDQIIKDSN